MNKINKQRNCFLKYLNACNNSAENLISKTALKPQWFKMEIKCETEKHEESGSITDGNESKNQNSSEIEISLSSTDQLIIGVVVGAVVLLLLILVIIIICKKRKRKGW